MFLIYFYLKFVKCILQELLSCRLGTVNEFHWEFKQVLSYSKPHTFSTFLEKKKKKKYKFTLSN